MTTTTFIPLGDVRLTDRTRTVTDWLCQRERFYLTEFGGTGIVSVKGKTELDFGTSMHAALAELARRPGQPDVVGALAPGLGREVLERETVALGSARARELAAIAEGAFRGFCQAVWPILLQHFDVVAVEQEVTLKVAPWLTFMAKPDLILRAKADGTYWYCLDARTRLLTEDLNWCAAGDIKEGMTLVGVEEFPHNAKHDKHSQYRRQARHWNTGRVTRTARLQRPCFRIRASDGTTVVCSADHQWLVPTERNKAAAGGTLNAVWTRTASLQVGTKLLKIIEPWTSSEWAPYDAGFVAAALEGEGSLAQARTSRAIHVSFAQKANVFLSRVKDTLTAYGVKFGIGAAHKGVHLLTVCGKAQVLRLLGIVKPLRLLHKLDINGLGGAYPIKPLTVTDITYLGVQEVVAIETTNHTFLAEGVISHNCEYKTTGQRAEDWLKQWPKAVQVHSAIVAAEATLGLKLSGCIVQGISKGYKDHKTGSFRSPFCEGWRWLGGSEVTYAYTYQRAKGWEKFAPADLEDGTAGWVEGMPRDLLDEQFPRTGPIFLRRDLADRFFAQLVERENEIRRAMIAIRDIANSVGLDDAAKDARIQHMMDAAFPMNFSACTGRYGKYDCPMLEACWTPTVNANPLASGLYKPREPHHDTEIALAAQRSATS